MQPSGNRKVIISFQPEHLLGWGVTILLCVIPLILWVQIHPLSSIKSFEAVMLNLGRVTGLVGMVMYALNLVYSTRLRFLERFFGGLNRVYIAHHLLGGLALIFLSFHPLFLALRYVTTSLKEAALLLLPNGLGPIDALFDTGSIYHPIVLEQWAIFFGIIAFWGMVGLLLVTFFIKLPYRVWLFTHKFLGLAFFLAGLHIFFVTSDTSVDTIMKFYMLGLTVIGLVAFVYRTIVGRILIRHYEYTVENVQIVAGNVTQLEMKPVKDKMMYKAGQFVFIRFRNTGTKLSKEWHPFSISSGTNDGYLQLSVKGLGDYTNFLANIKPGAIADIEGAYGRFTYTNIKNQNQIWVAGGIGITPFLSMARSLPDDGFQIDLYYSVRTTSELIDWQDLYDIAMAKNGHFRVIPYIGDQQPTFLGADYIDTTSGGLKGKDIFMCGPPPMMQSLRKQFKGKGVPGTSLHSEEFAMS
ncbi:MAG: ferric reductase-like transmembrane domain-containing protein [Candidatus Saccharimonadaceae bacterium]